MEEDPRPSPADLEQHLSLCAEVAAEARKVGAVADKMGRELQGDDDRISSKGLSILELKNHLMLEYLIDLNYVMLRKASGKSLADEAAAVERIVVNRTVMEKLRPIEQKLKYQIDKAVKVAESGEIRKDDPIHFKANPAAMISKLAADDEDDDDDDDDDEEKKAASGAKYVVPKHVPVYYNDDGGDENEATANEESEKRAKKQHLSRALIDDLKRQHLDAPEEIYEAEDVVRKRRVEAARERTRYEEEHFTRLPVTKKDKKAARGRGRAGMSTVATIGDEVTSFGRNYFNADNDNSGGKKRKRKSLGGSAAKKKKKFRK